MSTPWLTRSSRALALVAFAAFSAVVIVAVMRGRNTPPHDPSSSPHATTQSSTSATALGLYADAASCATCHAEIARTYAATGMARGFSVAQGSVAEGSVAQGSVAQGSVAQGFSPAKPEPLFHEASNRYYTMVEREGRVFQRRHQIGFDGREMNVLELEAHYVVGSGNHARTFLHRTPSGRLMQLPVSWYSNGVRLRADTPIASPFDVAQGAPSASRGAARQAFWEMSPGYDRPAHLDFRRAIDAGCMSCHTGYPRTPVDDDREGPLFGDSLPNGIDCQRCHGPGQKHIDAIGRNDVEAARRAIVNPDSLSRQRQLETCLQCHLESTSAPLPFQIRRYERAPFSFVPGQPLADYVIHFDHAPGTGHDDKFEINSAGYRLRQSACFQKSEMTCVTCHDPHDAPRGAAATQHYVRVCKTCHTDAHTSELASPKRSDGGCVDCHMPKRRAEDAVHVVMTDHFIQRARPARDLIAARTEAHGAAAYRGEVVPYYPVSLPASPENELYLAVAQVQDGSNLTAGIPRLQEAIERHRPARPDFYYDLARAYAKTANHDAVIRWSSEALVRDPAFVPALKELAGAALATGRLDEAAAALEKAALARPRDSNALADLGNVYLQQGRVDAARSALKRALEIDPDTPRANNTMGLTLLRQGDPDAAGRHFRAAIRAQPDLAEAHNNLGNLLASQRTYDEAAFHFAQAIASDPTYVDAHHSYGLVLALTKAYPRAVAEFETVIRLAPELLTARVDLAEVLMSMGRRGEARAHFEAAARSADPDVREAARAGLRATGSQ